jgi:hypothetical protein
MLAPWTEEVHPAKELGEGDGIDLVFGVVANLVDDTVIIR